MNQEPDVVLDIAKLKRAGEVFSIYIWRRDDEYLYVGMTSGVLNRLGGHNVIGKAEPLQPQDVVEVYNFPEAMGWYDVEALETELVKKHLPRYNRLHAGRCYGYGQKRAEAKQAREHPRVAVTSTERTVTTDG